jgi:hypothetical protein
VAFGQIEKEWYPDVNRVLKALNDVLDF